MEDKTHRTRRNKLNHRQQLSQGLRRRLLVAGFSMFLIGLGLTIYFQLGSNKKAHGAANGDYRTVASGDWSNFAIWQTYSSGSWNAAASAPSSSNNSINISNGHSVTVSSSLTVDELTIDAGATLTINSGTLTIANGSSTDLTINGSLDIVSGLTTASSSKINLNSQAFLRSSGTLTINSNNTFAIGSGYFKREGGTMTITSGYWTIAAGGTFEHAMNGGALPIMTWTTGSTCSVTGVTNALPTNISQSFRNLTWNCPTQSSNLNFTTNFKSIAGNLTFTNTGTGSIFLDQAGNNLTTTIGGNLNVLGGTVYICENGSGIVNVSGNAAISGGSLNFSKSDASSYGSVSGTVNLTGNLTVTGGSMDMSQYNGASADLGRGVLNLNGNLNVSGTGSITESQNGRGQIYFAGSSIQAYSISNQVSNSIDYIVNSGSILRCGTAVLSSEGNFTLNAGGHLMIGSSGGITQSGLEGNIQVSGSRNYNTGADYTYEGTAEQNSGDGLPSQVRNLTLNNPANCTLTNSSSVSGVLTFTSGNWIAPNDTLTLGINTSSTGALVRTSGHVAGFFRRWIPGSTASNILFPLGSSTSYNGVNFSFLTAPTSGSIVSLFVAENPGYYGLPINEGGDNCTNVGAGYWQFGAMNDFNSTNHSVNLYANNFSGVNNYTSLRLISRANSLSAWAFNGTHSAGTGNNSAPIVNRNGMSVLGHFGITSGSGNPLPVSLISFSAVAVDGKVTVEWKTASERNNKYFTVQRSADAKTFTDLAKLNGAGNSNIIKGYKYIDLEPLNGRSYYRLKQTDYDGKSETFEPVTVHLHDDASRLTNVTIYPNPFKDHFNLKLTSQNEEELTFEIISISGALSFTDNIHINRGNNSYNFSAPSGFQPGIYFIRISTKDRMLYSSKIICN